jgi:D-tyrosyl-tRNA(Tyr) deacylase
LNLLAQRVLSSSLYIEKKKIVSINRGILALVGFEKGDTPSDCKIIADKLLNYRIFPDDKGRMEKSVLDIKGDLLLVPEVTLALETRKGTRPSFSEAASPDTGKRLFDELSNQIRKIHDKLEVGIFGADMEINLINDGPVTFLFKSTDFKKNLD